MADVTAPATIEVKPWWQSLSTWVALGTIVATFAESIYLSGLLTSGSTAYLVIGAIVTVATSLGLLAKRGFVEAQAIKANAMLAAVSANPPAPSVPAKP